MGKFAKKQLLLSKEEFTDVASTDTGWFNKYMYSVKSWIGNNFSPKSHTHSDIASVANSAALGAAPDFSRATLMYGQDSNGAPRVRIAKINVPGYIFYTQNRYNLDTDHAIMVAAHPGYLYNPYTENIHIRANGSHTTTARPNYLTNRAMLGGNSHNDGDTYLMGYYPIIPGTSTYVYPSCSFGGGGWTYYKWVFVPCHCVDTLVTASQYFTWVGVSQWLLLREGGINGCGFLSDTVIKNAFIGDWKTNLTNNNPIYIPTIFVSGTRWNWNSVNSADYNGTTVGVRFDMYDACATGKNRRWLQYNDRSNRQIYWDSAGYWALGEGNNQRYRATDANGSKDPWDLTWYNSYDSDTRVCTLTKKITF